MLPPGSAGGHGPAPRGRYCPRHVRTGRGRGRALRRQSLQKPPPPAALADPLVPKSRGSGTRLKLVREKERALGGRGAGTALSAGGGGHRRELRPHVRNTPGRSGATRRGGSSHEPHSVALRARDTSASGVPSPGSGLCKEPHS